MENNYSNYDMLDKLIANNKKAKSWTAIWVIMLSLMAAVVLWMANTVSVKNKKIDEQITLIKSNQEILELKSRIIDSLTENCNDAKTEIIKDYDSVISKTQTALAILTTVNTQAQNGDTVKLSAEQQESIKKTSTYIKQIKSNIDLTKIAIEKNNTRLFIQYNNRENAKDIARLLSYIKDNSEYVVAPPEYVDKPFSTQITFYNYKNEKEESLLKDIIGKLLNISPNSIEVNYEKNPRIKTTVEVWIGTRVTPIRALKLQKQF